MTPFWQRRLLPVFWAVLALNAAVFAAWTLPRTAQHRSVAVRATVVQGELERERERLAALKARAEAIIGNDADAARFFARVGGKPSLLTVQEDLARAGREAGVKLGHRAYATKAVKDGGALARFEITMPVQGGYREITGFLDRLERLPHLVVVEKVTLKSGRDASAAQDGHLEIALAAYFRDEEGRLAP